MRSPDVVRRLLAAIVIGAIGSITPVHAQQPQDWRLSPHVVALGDGADELFQSIRFGQILPTGEVAIADAGLLEVRVFRPGGPRVARFGSEGSGPGEFRSINGLWTTADGRIGVWDAESRRLSIFSSDGTLIESRSVSRPASLPGNLEVFFGTFSNRDVLLASLDFGAGRRADRPVPDRVRLARFSLQGEMRDTLGTIDGLHRTVRFPVPFTPLPRAAVRMDSVWVADPFDPQIVVLDSRGRAARRFVVAGITPATPNVRLVHAQLERGLRERNRTFFLEMLPQSPPPQRFPAIGGLLLDRLAGLAWVRGYDPTTDALWLRPGSALETIPGGTWRVVDDRGRSVASITIPRSMALLDVRGTQVLALERDEWDVERAVLLQVMPRTAR